MAQHRKLRGRGDPEEDDYSYEEQSIEAYSTAAPAASWAFGGVLLLFLMVAFFLPEFNADQRSLLRFFMALVSSFFAVFFVGGVLLKGTMRGLIISATGGFVLFILIQFVFDPFTR